jgi:hypothetical protein
MSNSYEQVNGYGDTITCDLCSDITGEWYSDGNHAICASCEQKSCECIECEEDRKVQNGSNVYL